MKRVVIESPYSGDIEAHEAYARRCMLDSLERGEAPFLSHLLYTQVLNDLVPDDREKGIRAGLSWGYAADVIAVYTDYGMSEGMARAVETHANRGGSKVEFRKIGKNEP